MEQRIDELIASNKRYLAKTQTQPAQTLTYAEDLVLALFIIIFAFLLGGALA